MRIEAIEQTRSPQGKLRVCFDDGSRMMVLPAVVADLSLGVGLELSASAMDSLRQSSGEASAKERAVRILSAAPISRGELLRRLTEKGETPENAELAVAWLEELNLLDDASVAKQIVRSGAARGYGAGRIRQMLYEKRIPKHLWEEALQELPIQDDAIDAFLQKRFRGTTPDWKELKRAADALARRGHSWNDIRRALERYAPDECFPEE